MDIKVPYLVPISAGNVELRLLQCTFPELRPLRSYYYRYTAQFPAQEWRTGRTDVGDLSTSPYSRKSVGGVEPDIRICCARLALLAHVCVCSMVEGHGAQAYRDNACHVAIAHGVAASRLNLLLTI